MRRWVLALSIFPVLICLHLRLAPYTKVEESFNIQAVHDILTYGIPTEDVGTTFKAQYDHMTFPGAVPRTFIGALVLSGISNPILWLNSFIDRQQLVRAILGLFNAASLVAYTIGVRRAFGRTAALWYIAFQASQFHIIFYASRTLPNMFAFGMSASYPCVYYCVFAYVFAIATFALRLLLPDPSLNRSTQLKRIRLSSYLLILATVIFRSELALLVGSHILYLLYAKSGSSIQSRLSMIRKAILPAGLMGLLLGLVLTISIDTYFWQSHTPIWPELFAFMSNIFPSDNSLGASAWGTSPWHYYFTSALPRLILNPFAAFLIPYSLTQPSTRKPSFDLLIPNTAYILLYSVLAHKETRFLFPVLPPFTAAAALAAAHFSNRRNRKTFYSIITYAIVLSTIATFIISHAVLLPLSAHSYPGAHALIALHTYTSTHAYDQNAISVHLDNLALQTGVTRFLQIPPPIKHLTRTDQIPNPASTTGTTWHYDKSDSAAIFLSPPYWTQFDYAIMETPALAGIVQTPIPEIGSWAVIDIIYGLGRPRILRPEETGSDDVIEQLYGKRAGRGYHLMREALRGGWGLGKGRSWTGGWWVEVEMVERLFVLKREQ